MKYIFFIISSVFLFFESKAQTECPPISIYKTLTVSEIKDSAQLKLPLQFTISTDSIVAVSDNIWRRKFFEFRILGKECFWNKELTKGRTVYRAMLYNVKRNLYPTITINYTDSVKKYIEIAYENGRNRFFPIAEEN